MPPHSVRRLHGADFELRLFRERFRARLEVPSQSLAVDASDGRIRNDAVAIVERGDASFSGCFA
jgi:hypothetical protein